MTRTISMQTSKTQIMQIFREIEESGEALIITDHGRPTLRVIPIDQQPSAKKLTVEEAFADWRGKTEFLEDPDTPTIDEWEDV